MLIDEETFLFGLFCFAPIRSGLFGSVSEQVQKIETNRIILFWFTKKYRYSDQVLVCFVSNRKNPLFRGFPNANVRTLNPSWQDFFMQHAGCPADGSETLVYN